jgi:MarR family transcriptional regulator, organic hydroperoxide resistance regulator
MAGPATARKARRAADPVAGRPPLEARATFLVHRINAQILQICNPVMARHDLDLYSSRILVALGERGTMKVGALVELMALPQSTISHQLKRLEKLGYLMRARSEKDNRSVEVTLTPRGLELAGICDRMSDAVLGPVLAALSREESETLARLLGRMFDALPDSAAVAAEIEASPRD